MFGCVVSGRTRGKSLDPSPCETWIWVPQCIRDKFRSWSWSRVSPQPVSPVTAIGTWTWMSWGFNHIWPGILWCVVCVVDLWMLSWFITRLISGLLVISNLQKHRTVKFARDSPRASFLCRKTKKPHLVGGVNSFASLIRLASDLSAGIILEPTKQSSHN